VQRVGGGDIHVYNDTGLESVAVDVVVVVDSL
jgi:hypothetical protein